MTLTVSNDGDPISEPNRGKIFDAFFTTRRDTGGTGMGLAIVKAVMTSHGGSIRLLPADRGAAFELEFPAYVMWPLANVAPAVAPGHAVPVPSSSAFYPS